MERLKNVDWMDVFIVVFIGLAVVGLICIMLLVVFSIVETEFQERDKQVIECMATERYTRQECIELAGNE